MMGNQRAPAPAQRTTERFNMDVKATLPPGANGTKALVRKYGDQLVCVRYRYDKTTRKRYKTVELIVEEKDWQPGSISYSDKKVFVRIDYGETDLRELLERHGGYWNPDKKAWHILYRKVVELGLEKRLLDSELPF
jgi:hypothetical protein